MAFAVICPSYPIIVDLGYDEETSKRRQLYTKKHVHGRAIKRMLGTITRQVDGVLVSEPAEYLRFKLDNGEEFWEFERKDWSHLTGYWQDDEQCCKDAFEAARAADPL